MKTLYLDCSMGAAGDMLTAALYELLDDNQKAEFIDKINSLGIPGVRVEAETSTKCGIVGTHMKVTINGAEEHEHHHVHEHTHEHAHHHEHEHEHTHEHEHAHPHEHTHTHEHHHSSMHDIEHITEQLAVSEQVRDDVIRVYSLIAEAESHAHGKPVSEIHFHEVGTADAIADVTAVCMLIDMLGRPNVVASPVHVGSGQVHCAHGILPVPAPATAHILRGVPVYGGEIRGELCTPTGAALLKHFVSEFGSMPAMTAENIGYGMGRKDFPAANCVRAIIGECAGAGSRIIELTCNVDDMTAERVGFAMEELFAAGALEVYTVPVGMKKSRPGIMLCTMCAEEKRDEIVRMIFRHTTTLGIRENVSKRYTLARRIDTIETELGPVRVKRSEGYGVIRTKYEYEDIAKIAAERGISIDEAIGIIDRK